MTNNPYDNNNPDGSKRNRRSQRHGSIPQEREDRLPRDNVYPRDERAPQEYVYQPNDAAPLPLGSEPRAYVPPIPRPPVGRPDAQGRYEYDGFAPAQEARDNYYEDDDYAPRLWPKFLALFLGLILLIAAGLYFLVPEDSAGLLGTVRVSLGSAVDGAMGLLGIKEEKVPTLIKFDTAEAVAATGVRTVFTFTTDIPVDSVRMVDEAGNEMMGQLAAIDDQRTLWTLTVVFDKPFTGSLRGELLLDNVWYGSDKVISFAASQPSPTPVLTPESTTEPSPFPQVSADPVGDAPDFLSLAQKAEAADEAGQVPDGADDFIVLPAADTRPTDVPVTAMPAATPLPTARQTLVPSPAPTAVPTATVMAAKASPTPSAEPFVVLRNTQTPIPAVTSADQTDGTLPVSASAGDVAAWDETSAEETANTDETAEGILMESADQTADETAEETNGTEQTNTAAQFSEWDEVDPAALAAAAAAAQSGDMLTEDQVPASQTAALPLLPMTPDESALPSNFNLKEDVYHKAKKVKELERENPLRLPLPPDYVYYEGGVFTFRNDSFRGNAAFGQADMPLEQLSVLWKAPLGSLRIDGGQTLYGLGYTGQPAIVKWSVELRQMMNINDDKKEVKALKEVIAAAQDGKVYFFDLNDGQPTREPIDIGYPLKGSVAVDTMGRPMISFGQGISKLPGKTGPIGFYLYDLIAQKELIFLNGRKTKSQTQYSTNGAFDSTALFDRESDSMIVVGENGLFYTVSLNTTFDYLDKMTITIDPVITYNKSKTANQKDMNVTAEASVAMYGKYAYIVDKEGILKAIDTDSMLTQWVFDTGDNTDASPALGFDEDGSLGLYTGTTVYARSKKAGEAVIRKIDAMSGKELWQHALPAGYDQSERGGVKASPVVGEKSISDLVIFTVNLTGQDKNSTVIALHKLTGEEVWSFPLNSPSISSPVAVYRENGDAFLVQADEKGVLYLLRAASGELINTLDLEASLSGSPAVYNDVLVIGTDDKDSSYLYGIRLE